MKDLTQTQFFLVESPQEADVHEVLAEVYESMVEKGYNPVNQIVGPATRPISPAIILPEA